MGWLSSLFSVVGVDLAKTVGSVMDELTTSDEELALTENQKLKIQVAYEVRMRELLAQLDRQQAEHEENLEFELTQRLQLDMKSDSWLSKNVRPLTLIFMTALVAILAVFTVFDGGLTDNQLSTLKEWIPFFSTLMMVVYGFYFGSRGLEKIQKIRSSSATDAARAERRLWTLQQEPKG